MKTRWCLVLFILICYTLSACEANSASTPVRSHSPEPTTSILPIPVSTLDTSLPTPILEGFQLPSHDELLLFDHHLSDLTGWVITRKKIAAESGQLLVSITANKGETWETAVLPTTQPWEKQIDKNRLFTSLNISGSSWIMLVSNPSMINVNKTLYRSDNSGKSWTFIADLTSTVKGDITGISFLNDKNGWIASNYSGEDLTPLYQTKDGGSTWTYEKLPIDKEYRYGNVHLPYIDLNGHGTVKVDYAGDNSRKSIFYETNDFGQSWHIFTVASILQLKGNKDVLDTVWQFVEAMLAKDIEKINALSEQKLPDSDITWMKTRNFTFYSAVFPPQELDSQDEPGIMLQYQTDDQFGYNENVMSIFLHKQKNGKWKVYMLD